MMTWLTLYYALSLGWVPVGDLAMYDKPFYVEQSAPETYVKMEAEARMFDGRLRIGGFIQIYEWPQGFADFFPERGGFAFSAGFYPFKDDRASVVFTHYCTHPVTVDSSLSFLWEGAYETVEFRISGNSKIF